ncbi:winged helix-turn-helix transcriptional regulator [Arenibacter sp. GZD-96]|uniref:winged helix-turn-helix transcriptional regulator n=1 Tax=Aurantibrevibacter litoralis TaxID=3106030 RepID=UPI003A4D35FD
MLVDGLVESQQKIVWLIAENTKISKQEMSELIGISSTAINNNIKCLKEKGLVERKGSQRTGYWELIMEK